MDLVGFTSSGLSHTNWVGFRENLPGRLDRLIGEQRMLPDRPRVCHGASWAWSEDGTELTFKCATASNGICRRGGTVASEANTTP
jgi:hypothetical protein